jgi:hypothetical protein
MKFVIDAHPAFLKKLNKVRNDLNLGHISQNDLVTIMFIGSLYMLEHNDETMVDFVLANTSLDS